jgi:hypothetical protein
MQTIGEPRRAADTAMGGSVWARVWCQVYRSQDLGAIPPKKTVWKLDRHSEAKHYLLRRYLQAWLPIMSSWQRRLVLIDGFAGPSVYEDGQAGRRSSC